MNTTDRSVTGAQTAHTAVDTSNAPRIEPHVPPSSSPATSAARGRGRPKLGVVSREVTLLPHHWEWLARQPGGASVALRKLVDQAMSTTASSDPLDHSTPAG